MYHLSTAVRCERASCSPLYFCNGNSHSLISDDNGLTLAPLRGVFFVNSSCSQTFDRLRELVSLLENQITENKTGLMSPTMANFSHHRWCCPCAPWYTHHYYYFFALCFLTFKYFANDLLEQKLKTWKHQCLRRQAEESHIYTNIPYENGMR